MALIEGLPDSPRISPRISFSHDLAPNDDNNLDVPVERYIRPNSSSAVDFDFCFFRHGFDQEPSSADELFSGGKILPIEIKKRLPPPKLPPPRRIHEPVPTKCPDSSEIDEKQNNYKPSFWRIKRSTSLNCSSGYAGTLCPLPILSRSNSTGSTSSTKRAPIQNNSKQNLTRYSAQSHSLKPPPSSKPPLKKSSHGSYGSSGVKINPILNVPTVNLFGLGSIFSGSKKKY